MNPNEVVPPAARAGPPGAPVNEADFHRRWKSEATFFDELAQRVPESALLLDPAVVQRYRRAWQPWFNKEFRFRLLGRIEGKRVLDVGCGEGTNAMLLAALGGRVTGVDVSPASIELARRRAARAGMADHVSFQCAPLEQTELPDGSFDVIWGDGILHHLLPVLETTLSRLVRWAKPGALFLFSEPVDRAPWVRRLRERLPFRAEATQDERPLSLAELATIRRFIPGLKGRAFGGLSRLERAFLPDGSYERAPLASRAAVSALALADRALFSLPGLERLGTMLVLWGTQGA